MFEVEGELYDLNQMLEANRDDATLCEWLRRAEVGDRFLAINSCVRVS